jgi:hypothetical protein
MKKGSPRFFVNIAVPKFGEMQTLVLHAEDSLVPSAAQNADLPAMKNFLQTDVRTVVIPPILMNHCHRLNQKTLFRKMVRFLSGYTS